MVSAITKFAERMKAARDAERQRAHEVAAGDDE